MPDHPRGRPAAAGLAPDIRDRLIRLLAGELIAAWDAAVTAGAAPTGLAEIVGERQRAIRRCDPAPTAFRSKPRPGSP
jgi:hypothetical protein